MLNSAFWPEELAQKSTRIPLRYVNGMRIPLRRGICCQVHSHSAVEIVYHETGSGITRLSEREIPFAQGSVVIYAPEEKHDQVMDVAGEDWCIQIAVPATEKFPECLLIPGIEEMWIIDEIQHLSRGQAQVSALEQAVLDLRATAVLLTLLQTAFAKSDQSNLSPAEKNVRMAEQYLRTHFATIDSLQEVADHVGISPDHLRHLFKAQRGLPLIRHLNELRIARAKSLLTNSALSLKQIASLSGYRDEYYFATVFRKLTGCAPGYYRRRGAVRDAVSG